MYNAEVDDFGNKFWIKNGALHRVDGPAEEWANGSKLWHVNGKKHRVDGPAVILVDGTKQWFLNDIQMNQATHAYHSRKFQW